MKKILMTLAAVFCCWITLCAQQLTEQQAMERALQYMNSGKASPAVRRMAAPANGGRIKLKAIPVEAEKIYVFNIEGGGYVIASGDDRTEPILGYSETGCLDMDNMPDNMRQWLAGYAQQLAQLGTADRQQLTAPVTRTAIEPLIKTQWYQKEPYNKYTYMIGDDHSLTGCVATAMAQVMNYWQWPKEPCKDIPGYVAKGGPIAPDPLEMPALPSYTFQWDQMLDTYTTDQPGTEEQQEAVARLMQYCGTAVHMYYDRGSSSTQQGYIASALRRYFDYAQDIYIADRQNYTNSQWEDLVYNELANGRPIPYAGDTDSGGHSFICDGYDGQGLYHINWGWGGRSDGYFRLSILNPYNTTSYGASPSSMGFALRHQMIVNVRPADQTATPVEEAPFRMLLMNDLHLVIWDTDTILCVDPYYSSYDYTYDKKFFFGLGVRENGVLNPLVIHDEETIYTGMNKTLKFSFKELQLPVGIYHLLPIWKESDKDDAQWQTMAPDNRCFYVEITPSDTLLKVLPEVKLQLERAYFSKGKGEIEEECWITLVLRNLGDELNTDVYFNASYGGSFDEHGNLIGSDGLMYGADSSTGLYLDAYATDSLELPFKTLRNGEVLYYLKNSSRVPLVHHTFNVTGEYALVDLELIDYNITIYTPDQMEKLKVDDCLQYSFTLKNNDTRKFKGSIELKSIEVPFSKATRKDIEPGETSSYSYTDGVWMFNFEDYYLMPEITFQLWQSDHNMYDKLLKEIKTKAGYSATPNGIDPITTTAIREVSKLDAGHNAIFYDLQGRQLKGNPIQQGIYIKDGKKVVVK